MSMARTAYRRWLAPLLESIKQKVQSRIMQDGQQLDNRVCQKDVSV